jgi:hypothetical protein
MAEVAEQLRLVRRASRRFLRLWTIDQAMVEPLVDRLADDLERSGAEPRGPAAMHDPGPPVDKH